MVIENCSAYCWKSNHTFGMPKKPKQDGEYPAYMHAIFTLQRSKAHRQALKPILFIQEQEVRCSSKSLLEII